MACGLHRSHYLVGDASQLASHGIAVGPASAGARNQPTGASLPDGVFALSLHSPEFGDPGSQLKLLADLW